MKERPIIFSGESVKAILAERKTQTRRVMKFSPEPSHITEFQDTWIKRCRYGQIDDKLWVRETYVIEEGESREPTDRPFKYDWEYGLLLPHYKATEPDIELVTEKQKDNITKWRPSIFMPRWASRITLEITEVRVERVQEITEEDAKTEGIIWVEIETAPQSGIYRPCAVENFSKLWNSLNAKRGYSWESNPWVWVISFRRIEP